MLSHGPKITCEECGKEFSYAGYSSHVWRAHGPGNKWSPTPKGTPAWNKGLTKETSASVKRTSEKLKEKIITGELQPFFKGKKHSESARQIMSEKKKIAHAEGRGACFGSNRWNREPSWPEKFFSQVIANEFNDKNYESEYRFGRFILDFAWPHKKKCIEIDGAQHDNFPDVQERDVRKNAYIASQEWAVLRIKWKDMKSDPKTWIQIAKDFIG